MKLKFGLTVLGSGSKGNASVIHGPEGNVLLDCGLPRKDLEHRLELSHIDPGSIFAVLITHSHIDHGRHFGFCKERNIPVYLQEETLHQLSGDKHAPCLCDCNCVQITPGTSFELCGMHVESFEVPHDVCTIGYTFQACGRKLGYATDIGNMTNLAKNKLIGSNILVLESNYDPVLLRQSHRPLRLIRRIMSRQGHLSNADAMDAIQAISTQETQAIILAHISQECNDPELVRELAENRLADINRNQIALRVASQDEPLPTIWME